MCHSHHHGPWGAERGHGPLGGFGPLRRPGRAPRGRIRAEILRLLRTGPKHGYELMNLIAEQSGGMWQPSPGSIYPTLQLLEDQGLVESVADGDRRTYRLTAAGEEEAARIPEHPPFGPGSFGSAIGPEVAQTMAALRTLALTATDAQREAAVQALAELRRRLYQILAE